MPRTSATTMMQLIVCYNDEKFVTKSRLHYHPCNESSLIPSKKCIYDMQLLCLESGRLKDWMAALKLLCRTYTENPFVVNLIFYRGSFITQIYSSWHASSYQFDIIMYLKLSVTQKHAQYKTPTYVRRSDL